MLLRNISIFVMVFMLSGIFVSFASDVASSDALPHIVNEYSGSDKIIDQNIWQYVKDMGRTLTNASDSQVAEHKRMGFKVIFFLMVFAFIMYRVKKKKWNELSCDK